MSKWQKYVSPAVSAVMVCFGLLLIFAPSGRSVEINSDAADAVEYIPEPELSGAVYDRVWFEGQVELREDSTPGVARFKLKGDQRWFVADIKRFPIAEKLQAGDKLSLAYLRLRRANEREVIDVYWMSFGWAVDKDR